ncbi:MAG: hypothetical protein ABIW79_09060 [Gemmatimonas sp.]
MTRYLPLVLLLVVACGPKDESITIKGDVPNLEQMAKRGDSLVAHATSPILVDSLRFPPPVDSNGGATARTETAGRLDSNAGETRGIDNDMSRRAQARGDSLARADARRRFANVETTSRARRDTVRGIVTLTGSSSAPQPALRDASGASISLSGMATSGLARLQGADVLVRGIKISSRNVVVTDYIVRAVDGVAAWDGRLEQTNGGWSLELTDGTGRKRVASAPTALRALVGERVWISMRSADATHAFGLIGRR